MNWELMASPLGLLRERAREIIEIGNNIEEKIEQVRKLEQEIEKLQVYRNERGDQLLHELMEVKEKTKNENADGKRLE